MDLDTFRYYTRWHDHVNRERYDAPADPERFLWVDPTAVEHCVPGVGLYGLGRVEGGNWDRDPRPLAEMPGYRGIVERFDEGKHWEETRLVEWARERVDAGERPRNYADLDSFVEQRCAYLDDLYERIAATGYRPNARAGHDNPAAEDNPYENAYAHHLEPLVAVSRDGDVLWVEGFHRLAIAAVQGIDSIPVQVVCRHREWQRVRDELTTSEKPPEQVARHRDHPDHPDLADLV